MTHFTQSELRMWSESGPGNDRDRIVAHLAECAKCASVYAEAIRTRPLEGEVPADVRRYVDAGRRVTDEREPRWSFRIAWTLPLAAVAALIVIFALPRQPQPQSSTAAPVFRGSNLHALAPEGAVDAAHLEFSWSNGMTAGKYRLEVGNAEGSIYKTETTESRFVAPAALVSLLKPGSEYWWSVTALDQDSQPLATSERRTFTLQPR